jgi:hypothetical protein
MESYTKEQRIKIFDVNAIEPGDVIQYYRFSETSCTASENALVAKVTEKEITAVEYRDKQILYVYFYPEDQGVEIKNVVKKGQL